MERLTVRDLLESLARCAEPPVVTTESSLKEVVLAMLKGCRCGFVYVVDDHGKLKGAITLEDLKNVIFHYYLHAKVRDALVVTEHIEEIFTSEKAQDVMKPCHMFCYEDETLHDIVIRMNEWDALDVPVLNRQGRIIADLDILCLLELWLQKGNEAF